MVGKLIFFNSWFGLLGMLIYSDIVELIRTFNYVAEFLYVNNTMQKSIKMCLLSKYFYIYTLKNKGTSQCHRITHFFLKWFHKEHLTSEEPFSLSKGSLW